LTWSVSYQIT